VIFDVSIDIYIDFGVISFSVISFRTHRNNGKKCNLPKTPEKTCGIVSKYGILKKLKMIIDVCNIWIDSFKY
jgi:hypothetical protein